MRDLCIELSTGRLIYGTSLQQNLTYEGLIEGYPNSRVNQELLDSLEQRLRQQSSAYHIVPASPRKYLRRPGDLDRIISMDPPFEVACLPRVTSVARFECSAGLTDNPDYNSELTVSWFQDEFGLPTEAVEAQLRALDWEQLARDYDITDI